MFDAEKVKNDIVAWIREWFEVNGKGCNAVLGVSGGKDSSVVAALCAEALGPDRVVGVMMPRGEQFDIDVSRALIDHLGIRGIEVNVGEACDAVEKQVEAAFGEVSVQTKTNIPPRVRMTMLYATSQTVNGRVANTCNLSEDYVGYNTIFGDNAGDFSPLAMLTVQEVKAVGRALGLPSMLWIRFRSTGCRERPMKTIWDSHTQFWTDTSAKASVKIRWQRNESTKSIR